MRNRTLAIGIPARRIRVSSHVWMNQAWLVRISDMSSFTDWGRISASTIHRAVRD
jgi:hypothetical protein